MCRQVLVGSSSGNKGKLFSKALIHLTDARKNEGYDDELVYIECPLYAAYDDENDVNKKLELFCDNPDFGLIIITDIDFKCFYELKWLLRKIDKEKVFVISTVQNLVDSLNLHSIKVYNPKIISDQCADNVPLASFVLARPTSEILKEIKSSKKTSDKQLDTLETMEGNAMSINKPQSNEKANPTPSTGPRFDFGDITGNIEIITASDCAQISVIKNSNEGIDKEFVLNLIENFRKETLPALQLNEADEAQNCLNEIEIELKKPDPNTNIIVKRLNMLKKFKGAIEFVKVVAEACNVVKELYQTLINQST